MIGATNALCSIIKEPLKLQNLLILDDQGRSKPQNLCFVNAAVQLLASVKTFKTFFIERRYTSSDEQMDNNSEFTICDTLHEIFASNGQIEASCSSLRSLVAEKSGIKDLSNKELHDCQEFHFALLDSLEKEFHENECEAGLELMKIFFGEEAEIEMGFLGTKKVVFKQNKTLEG